MLQVYCGWFAISMRVATDNCYLVLTMVAHWIITYCARTQVHDAPADRRLCGPNMLLFYRRRIRNAGRVVPTASADEEAARTGWSACPWSSLSGSQTNPQERLLALSHPIASAAHFPQTPSLTMPARPLIPAIILLGTGAALAQQTQTPVCASPACRSV